MRRNDFIFFCLVMVIAVCISFVLKSSKNNSSNDEISLGDTVIGDINGNGRPDAQDYIAVRKHILKQKILTGEQYNIADANNDGYVNSLDYIVIRKLIIERYSEKTKPSQGVLGAFYEREVGPSEEPLSGSSGDGSGTTEPTAPPASTKEVMSTDSSYSYSMIVYNFDVTDSKFGADKTGKNDSTEAFQKALNAAAASSIGGTVFVPEGQYLISDTLVVKDNTALIGVLKEGTTTGTVLKIVENAKGEKSSAIQINRYASVQNIAFWYPNQKITSTNGDYKAVKYPATIVSNPLTPEDPNPSDYITLENLNFVNSYDAMDLHASSVQSIRRIYGTPLHTGIINDRNWDTTKMDNINFSPDYWANTNLPNSPNRNDIANVLANSNTKPTAIIFERVDWAFLSHIHIDAYYTGIKMKNSEVKDENGNSWGGSEGEIYNSTIVNCRYPIYVDNARSWAITQSTLGGINGIYLGDNYLYDFSIANTVINANENSIYQKGKGSLAIVSSTINGNIYKDYKSNTSRMTIEGTNLTNTGHDSYSVGANMAITTRGDDEVKNLRVNTKPKSGEGRLIKDKVGFADNLQAAINELSKTGGIVYIARGTYELDKPIIVKPGVEIRGAVSWLHNLGGGSNPTLITYDIDTIKGPLFTLENGAGINGISIGLKGNGVKDDVIKDSFNNTGGRYPYAIKAEEGSSGVYIINVHLGTLWNGIDLTKTNNHYVENVTGSIYNIGINVGGGSANGIIRDCHFQLSMFSNTKEWARARSLARQTTFKIGKSTNQTIFNTFVFGPGIGYEFTDTSVYAVGIGSDFSTVGVKINGNTIGQIINPMMVIKPWGQRDIKTNIEDGKGHYIEDNKLIKDPADIHYIETTGSFTTTNGRLSIFNLLNSGSYESPAFIFRGNGDLHVSGGIIQASKSPTIITSNISQQIIGVIIGCVDGVCSEPPGPNIIQTQQGVRDLILVGNLCVTANSCADAVDNQAGINITNIDCPLIQMP